jgi:hypothetical protein
MSVNDIFLLLCLAVQEENVHAVQFLLERLANENLPHEMAMREGERLCVMAACDGSADILRALSKFAAFKQCFIPNVHSTTDQCRYITDQHNMRRHVIAPSASDDTSSKVEPPPETVESLVEQALAKHGSIFITKSDGGKRWGISKKPDEPPAIESGQSDTLMSSLHLFLKLA